MRLEPLNENKILVTGRIRATNSTDFLLPSAVVFCEGAFNSSCATTYGTFTDFAAQYQTNIVSSGHPVTQAFDNSTQQGIGAFTINANAPAGAKEIGTIFLVYDTFTCDITNPNCDPTQTGFSQLLSAPAEVDVVGSAVPEPQTMGLMGLASLAIIALKRRQRR